MEQLPLGVSLEIRASPDSHSVHIAHSPGFLQTDNEDNAYSLSFFGFAVRKPFSCLNQSEFSAISTREWQSEKAEIQLG